MAGGYLLFRAADFDTCRIFELLQALPAAADICGGDISMARLAALRRQALAASLLRRQPAFLIHTYGFG